MFNLLAWLIVAFFSYRYYKERSLAAAVTYAGGVGILFVIIDRQLLPIWVVLMFALALGLIVSGFDKRNP